VLTLILGLALAAAPAPPRCPFLSSADDADRALLDDRVQITLGPGGVTTPGEDGFRRPTRKGDLSLVPWARWRQGVAWRMKGGALAKIIVDDPLVFAPADLATLWTTDGQPLPAADGVSGYYRLVGQKPSWIVEAALRFPDDSRIDAAVFLEGALASDSACQDAALHRLATIRPGSRPRDAGGRQESVDLPGVGRLSVAVPAGFASTVSAGNGQIEVDIVRWADGRDTLEFTVDPGAVPGRVLVKPKWKRIYGRPAGLRAAGTGVLVEVRASTTRQRGALRKIARQATIEAKG
jgi:hypothetical protein